MIYVWSARRGTVPDRLPPTRVSRYHYYVLSYYPHYYDYYYYHYYYYCCYYALLLLSSLFPARLAKLPGGGGAFWEARGLPQALS